MKLILCKSCQDVVRLQTNELRFCQCGASGGKYLNTLDAIYFGDSAVPLGFNNHSLGPAIFKQPKVGKGLGFNAFIIPEICPTFTKVTVEEARKLQEERMSKVIPCADLNKEAEELINKFRMILMDADTECGNEILCTLIAKQCALVSLTEAKKWVKNEWRIMLIEQLEKTIKNY